MRISATKFKTNCLKLIDEVNLTKNEIIIIKHGKPIAKLVGIEDQPSNDLLIGGLTGVGKTNEDLTIPIKE